MTSRTTTFKKMAIMPRIRKATPKASPISTVTILYAIALYRMKNKQANNRRNDETSEIACLQLYKNIR
uniref:Uncharacterized protein n=1 Tax=Romanomermis culicivorax TaxID=13658 RepID=A0A915KQH6_ROMCU